MTDTRHPANPPEKGLLDGMHLPGQEHEQTAQQLDALRTATAQGWADIDAGRYVDLTDDQLENTIAQLGQEAVRRVAARNR